MTIEKKVEKVVFMAGPYKGYDLSYVALCDTRYLKRMLKISDLEKKTKNLIKQALAKTKLFLTFCFNHQPTSPATKTIKAHVCLATNPTAFLRKLRIPPTTLPTMAGNASAAFPASLLSAFANLYNHFFKTPSFFGGEPPASPPLPKTPVMARTIIEIVIEKAVSIENIVMPCSRNKVRIPSVRDVSLSRTFAMVYLILATCIWRSCRFCDNVSSLACFSVFKSSNLSLCNCLCSSV